MNTSAAGEAYANLRQRNQFASLTAIGMASLFWCDGPRPGQPLCPGGDGAAGGGQCRDHLAHRLLQMLLLAVLAWPLAGGPRRQRVGLWLAGAVAYLARGPGPAALLEARHGRDGANVWGRLRRGQDCSSRSRAVVQRAAPDRAEALAGLGLGRAGLRALHHALSTARAFATSWTTRTTCRCTWRWNWAFPAALLVCGGLLVGCRARAGPGAKPNPARQLAWAVLAVIGVHSLLEYPLWYGPFQIAFGLCLGLLWPAAPASPDAGRATRAGACGAARWRACVGRLCLCRLGLPPRQPDLSAARSARAGYRDDPLPRSPRFLAVSQPGPLCRTDASRR